MPLAKGGTLVQRWATAPLLLRSPPSLTQRDATLQEDATVFNLLHVN